tara:strand:+ start:78 stop:1082 length:1005 start_codon:yes stop_codon:yes gene_type:complete
MAIDKRINYEMQGDEKPARNYLGKQKTVTVPVKWKSSPEAPATELAYITKKEKDLLIKKDLHGSLKKGPNTGPSGIMSLDSQGDYTRDFSQDAARSQMSRRDSEAAVRQEAELKKVLTGQVDRGQTVRPGPRTRQYSNLPEVMTMPDGRTKYIGSAYKSYGQPSFLGNLFSRGAPGYRGIKGLSPFGTPTFETRKRPDGTEYYYTEDEKFGETRDAVPFGILGLISALTDRFRKPKDMSEFNKLSLTAPADQKVYMPKGADPSMVINNPFDRLLFADDQGYVSASGTADDVTANLLGVPGTADDVMANLLGLPGSADDPYANLLGVPGTADYYG